MQVTQRSLDGLIQIDLAFHGDARGFFVERFNQKAFAEAGLPTDFVQDNHSRSAPGILRGLHYQYQPAQGKLVGCTVGRILDVAVDIRVDSPTFGQYESIELSDDNGRLLWIPPGFAHGFCVLGDAPADVYYKVTGLYNAQGEGGIRYDDPDIGIEWPLAQPTLSSRDEGLMSLAEYQQNPPAW